MQLSISYPSVYYVLSLFFSSPRSRTLTITNSARFSRLSLAKTDPNERNRGGFFIRRNLMTTICTAIYLGIGRRMRRRDPPPKERKTDLELLTRMGRVSSTVRKFADGKTRGFFLDIADRNPQFAPAVSHLTIGWKNQQCCSVFFLNEIEIDLPFLVLES